MTQTQEEDPLELLDHANAVTENEFFAPTIVDTVFNQYLDEQFTDQIPDASINLNENTTTHIINSPPKKRSKDSSSQLNSSVPIKFTPQST